MLRPGDIVTITPEKPAAGGRMLARHEGLVMLVAGAIPGEAVRVEIGRVERTMAYTDVIEVLEPHAARRPVTADPRCGGLVYAHIAYEEQLRLKGAVILDALVRLGRVPAPPPIEVTPSPEQGYRMRARLHVRDGRVGFFLEGTHTICDAALTNQLLPEAVRGVQLAARDLGSAGLRGDADIELAENCTGDQRALHVELAPDSVLASAEALRSIPGVTGLSWATADERRETRVYGSPIVTDVIGGVRLQRHARAFFQGNRHLMPVLVQAVLDACPAGQVIDLYAGVGLFGVCLAARGDKVVAVEGHGASVHDLRVNAEPYRDSLDVVHEPVEQFVLRVEPEGPFTLVLDPPRSGMSKEAAAGAVRIGADRIVFVSCDVATFARDVRRFLDVGYRLEAVRGFDLFPTTAHVEAVGVLIRD